MLLGESRCLAVALCLCIHGATILPAREDSGAGDPARELAAVQARVIAVVQQNMESCIAISDGTGFGSGVIVSPDGLVMTAGHVVSGGKETLEVFFPSGRTAQARLVGYNLDVDAALLRLVGSGPWPTARISTADAPRPGEWVVGLGHSGGYEVGRKPPVRTGRVLEIRQHLVVTDSVLIGGDSGGPLFNLDGELVGIHSSIGDVIAENRHVTMATFRRDWDRMLAGGRWGRLPELETKRRKDRSQGDSAQNAPPAPAPAAAAAGTARNASLGVTAVAGPRGLVIEAVAPGSPAERVGLRSGDLLLSINGQKMDSPQRLEQTLSVVPAGSAIQLEFQRNSNVLRLTVILQRF